MRRRTSAYPLEVLNTLLAALRGYRFEVSVVKDWSRDRTAQVECLVIPDAGKVRWIIGWAAIVSRGDGDKRV